MMRPHYRAEVVAFDGHEFIVVIDESNGKAAPSVTNAAEQVVDDLVHSYGPLLHHMIVYRDTDGVFDGLEVIDNKFRGFAPLRTTCLKEAFRKVINIGGWTT